MAITRLRALGVTDGTLTNTQINASAAIAKTKLAALDIVNADVNASAAIVQSKLGALASTNMPTGTCVQTALATSTDFVGNKNGLTPNNTEVKILEKAITLKTTDPYLLVTANLEIGTPGSYQDIDLALALGYKTASATTDPNDYSQFGGDSFTRQGVTNLNSFYVSDTKGAHSTGSEYWGESKVIQMYKQITATAGTVIYMACWCSTDGQYYFFRAQNQTANDTGAMGGISILEIKS